MQRKQNSNVFVILNRVCPEEGLDRWYLVTIQTTLLDPIAVVCSYGSRHTSWQQARIKPVASKQEAEILATKIIKSKIKRGYVIVHDFTIRGIEIPD
jgi:predicted DNA-binding WGR domain protein